MTDQKMTTDGLQDITNMLHTLCEHMEQNGITDNGDALGTFARLQDLYKNFGVYMLVPTAELWERAVNYFNTHIEGIQSVLTKYGVSAGTIEAVRIDYAGVLCGQFTFCATPVQMLELLQKIKAFRAWGADKYVLYFALMQQYLTTIVLADKFNAAFRNEGATGATKTAFMDGQYSPIDALCLQSLRNRHFFSVQDFDGVERVNVINWLDNLEAYANIGKYAVYYVVASVVFSATPEMLQEIPAPELLTGAIEALGAKSIREYAEKYTNRIRRNVEAMADNVAEMFEAETATEQEQAKQKAETWEPEQDKEKLRTSNTMLAIQSRPVRVGDNEKALYTAPIALSIRKYAQDHNISGISTYRINQVFECLDYMLRFGTPTNDGYIKINTTLSAFANECINRDANQSEKEEIKNALGVLDRLFIVVPRPRKVEAIRLVVLKKIAKTDTGIIELEIDVSAQVNKGATQVIGIDEYRELKKMCQSLAHSRFSAIIKLKTHQQESTLLDDIYGYTDEIETARISGETEVQIKKRIENHRRHLSRDKRKLEEMFKTAQDNGAILSYEKRQTGIGKYNVPTFVYEWKRPNTAGSSEEQEPADEQ